MKRKKRKWNGWMGMMQRMQDAKSALASKDLGSSQACGEEGRKVCEREEAYAKMQEV